MAATLHTYSDRDACLAALAQEIGARLGAVLQGQGRARALLPGGSSPRSLLPLLAQQALDWSRVDLSPSDERWVPAQAAHSNLAMLAAGLPAAQLLDPRQAATPAEAARRWGAQLCNWLPLSVVLLGVGEDGHFASLFPGMPGLVEALNPEAQPAALVGHAPVEPVTRLSPNLALLVRSDWLGLLVFGESKRQLIEATQADAPQMRALPLHALLHGEHSLDIYWAP